MGEGKSLKMPSRASILMSILERYKTCQKISSLKSTSLLGCFHRQASHTHLAVDHRARHPPAPHTAPQWTARSAADPQRPENRRGSAPAAPLSGPSACNWNQKVSTFFDVTNGYCNHEFSTQFQHILEWAVWRVLTLCLEMSFMPQQVRSNQ